MNKDSDYISVRFVQIKALSRGVDGPSSELPCQSGGREKGFVATDGKVRPNFTLARPHHFIPSSVYSLLMLRAAFLIEQNVVLWSGWHACADPYLDPQLALTLNQCATADQMRKGALEIVEMLYFEETYIV